jgi:Domain of unknown function (DUF4258)
VRRAQAQRDRARCEAWGRILSQIEADIRRLAQTRHVVVSQHAAGRISKRNIMFADIVVGAAAGKVIEDDPTYHVGPALLMLQRDGNGDPIHVVWGID